MKILYVTEDDPASIEKNCGIRLCVYVMDVRGEWALVLTHTATSHSELSSWLENTQEEIIEVSTTQQMPYGKGAMQ